jgi:hypothetical protein
MYKFSQISREQKTFLPKRGVFLINMNEKNREKEGVQAGPSVDPVKAKDTVDQSVLQLNAIDTRLAGVQLTEEAKVLLDKKSAELRLALETRGQKLNEKLYQELQDHLRQLEGAVGKGKVNASVIDELKKSEEANKEMRQLKAREWARGIENGAIVFGAVVAAPVNAAASALISMIKGIIQAFKK